MLPKYLRHDKAQIQLKGIFVAGLNVYVSATIVYKATGTQRRVVYHR